MECWGSCVAHCWLSDDAAPPRFACGLAGGSCSPSKGWCSALHSPADTATGCPLTPCLAGDGIWQILDLADLPVTAGHVSYLCHSLLGILWEVVLG